MALKYSGEVRQEDAARSGDFITESGREGLFGSEDNFHSASPPHDEGES